MSDLSDSFIAKLPHSRSAAVHTAYAKAPDYIVSAINQHCDKLRCVKDTEYERDCYGHYVLNRYGMRVKESCHYSPMEHHIPKNLEEAYKHFTIAASKGNTEATEELKHFKKGLFGWKLI